MTAVTPAQGQLETRALRMLRDGASPRQVFEATGIPPARLERLVRDFPGAAPVTTVTRPLAVAPATTAPQTTWLRAGDLFVRRHRRGGPAPSGAGRPQRRTAAAHSARAVADLDDAEQGGVVVPDHLQHPTRVEVALIALVDEDRLVTALQAVTPLQLKAKARAFREIQSGSLPFLTASVIVQLLNDHRTGVRALPPFATRAAEWQRSAGRPVIVPTEPDRASSRELNLR